MSKKKAGQKAENKAWGVGEGCSALSFAEGKTSLSHTDYIIYGCAIVYLTID